LVRIRIFLIFLLLLSATTSMAGRRWRAFVNWIDSADIAGADTSYIRWPEQDFIASLNAKLTHSSLHINYLDKSQDVKQTYSGVVSTRLSVPISLGIAYRGWGLSYSRDFSSSKVDDEFSFSTYGQTYGFEVLYRNSRSFTGTFTCDTDPSYELNFKAGDVSQKVYFANFYYVINHKRFSLPAAFLQTVVQRRSAGSWLASINYYRSISSFTDLPYDKVKSTKLSFGGGYAYNYVFGQEHCLLHASVVPLFNFFNINSVYTPEGKSSAFETLSVNGNFHLSFVYNVSRYVMGVSGVYYLSWQNMNNDLALVDLNWSSRVFIGVRF